MPRKKTHPARDDQVTGDTATASDGSSHPIQEIRAFNRFYTNLIGALDYSRHLYVPYTLTEARVLYELARSHRTDAADLRSELSLDAGYLSRLLGGFEKNKLVERAPSERDPRRQSITLTSRGRSTVELLDERSQESVGDLLATVPARDRPRLTAAMQTIRTILSKEPLPSEGSRPPAVSGERPSRREDVVLRLPGPGELGWIIQRNASLYASEYGWNEEYEALVARIVADFAQQHDPGLERVWMAELDGRPVGCVMCVRDHHDEDEDTAGRADHAPAQPAPGTARLRLLLVEPDARGLGIGDRLVSTCIDFARDVGYQDMVLWTNDVLTAARGIYQRHGFALTSEEPHHSFGADLVGQDWWLALRQTDSEGIAGDAMTPIPEHGR